MDRSTGTDSSNAAADAMQQREDELLRVARTDPASPYYTGADRARPDRRRFMIGALAAGSAAMLSKPSVAADASPGAVVREVPPDASKIQGYPLDDTSYGTVRSSRPKPASDSRRPRRGRRGR
jgi:hypothetical protein